jgi:predicted nucleic acid-binding protein
MVSWVLDTSVIAKWFFEEEGTERAEGYLTAMIGGEAEVHVPSSFFYEFANVIWARRAEGVSEDTARRLWADLETLPLEVTAESELFPETLAFAFRHDVTAYDAAFVVLARQQSCDLVTADGVLWEKIASECYWVKKL